MKPKKTKRRIIIKRKIAVTPEQISYKNINFLSQFVTEQGSIVPRAVTCVSLKDQRLIAREIKRARHLGLLQFTQTV